MQHFRLLWSRVLDLLDLPLNLSHASLKVLIPEHLVAKGNAELVILNAHGLDWCLGHWLSIGTLCVPGWRFDESLGDGTRLMICLSL